jgi:TolA-binding protein
LFLATQAATEVHEWPRALALAERALAEFPNSKSTNAARCDRGAALYELGRLEEAERELKAVAADGRGILNLRAEFLLGQILAARKQYDDAVRMFFKVAYGHGGPTAPEPYRRWQAEAVFAAARVLDDTQRIAPARKLYQEIIDEYPSSERASLARKSLEATRQR